MAPITGEVTINAPIEAVFDMVADERNEPRYNPRIVRAVMLTDVPIGAGSRFLVQPKNTGTRGEMTVTIVEYDPPHRLRNAITSSYMQVDGLLLLSPTERGTQLQWDWTMRLVGPMRILSPLLALIGPTWERRNWIDLKHHMEKRPS